MESYGSLVKEWKATAHWSRQLIFSSRSHSVLKTKFKNFLRTFTDHSYNVHGPSKYLKIALL